MARHDAPPTNAPALAAATLPDDPDEPTELGWRYVKRRQPDGSVAVEVVPLTPEDIFYPREGDQVVETSLHDQWRGYLRDAFAARLAADPTALVLSDVLVRWGQRGLRPTSPDVTVIHGVRPRREWRSFNVAREGVRPVLVVEITSRATADHDRTKKREEYRQAGVPWYIIIDPVGQPEAAPVHLVGYRLSAAGAEALTPDTRGWLWLEPVCLWLGVEGGRPRCYDEAGQPIPDYLEQTAARAAAEARAEAAEARLIAIAEKVEPW